MTITVEIPTEIEKQVQENISRGDTETARQLLLDALVPTVEASIILGTAPPELSYDEFMAQLNKLVEMASEYIDPNCPPLSDYATSRESFYEGRPKL